MPKLAFSILVVASLHSCKKEVIEKSNAITTTTSAARDNDEMMVLGNQLQNPYSVTNMLIAYQNLRAGNPSFPAMEITTTHRYLKFSPVDTTEFDKLVADTTIEFYDHPLDYEIVKNGNFYRDPELDPSIPFTHQYCVVPINQSNAPSAPNVVLAELYLPNEHTDNPFIEDLIDEALRITNNVDTSSLQVGKVNGKKYHPKGTIEYFDPLLNRLVPLKGAKARVTKWFETRTKITDGNGYFKIDAEFRHDVNFSIKWENSHWDLREGLYGQANLNGPHQRGDWNHDIWGGFQQKYAIINSACQDYYFGNRFGLKSPPTTGPKVKIAVLDEDTSKDGTIGGHNKNYRLFGISSRIKIYAKNKYVPGLYSTTIHELAHASHWELRKHNWDSNTYTEKRLKESWANAVELIFTNERYSNNYENGYQSLSALDEPEYTSIIVDLNDFNNQNLTGSSYPIDNVSGYSYLQIENVLNNSTGFTSLKAQLKNTYNNSTETKLDELFSNWP